METLKCTVDASSPNDSGTGLLSSILAVTRKRPDSLALDDGITSATFAELNTLSDTIVQSLRPHVQPRDIIPIITTLSTETVACILAIMKLDCTYVPIDGSQMSKQKVTAALHSIQAPLLLCSEHLLPTIPFDFERIDIADLAPHTCQKHCLVKRKLGLSNGQAPVHGVPADEQITCMIFTSGTSGSPRGVMIRETALLNFVASRRAFLSNEDSRVLVPPSISFDACNSYLFATLCHGATAVLASIDRLQSLATTCTALILTPSVLASLEPPSLLMSYSRVRHIILGGETATQSLLAVWHSPEATWTLYNDYGPTEATCSVLTGRIEKLSDATYDNDLLGIPIPGTRVILIDSKGDEVMAPGQDGEIIIGGVSLSAGYWNDDLRNARSFSERDGRRYYHTGDQAAWCSRHSVPRLRFKGRRDRLTKHRGFLVNLETEVDAAVKSLPVATTCGIVTDAYTIMIEGRMCMLVCPATVDIVHLRQSLRECMAAFQIPDCILAADKIPLGHTGKTDESAISKLFKSYAIHAAGEPMNHVCTWLETEISAELRNMLGLERPISLSEKFLDLGGNSLAAIALSGFCKKIGYEIQPTQILVSNSISQLLRTLKIIPQHIDPPTPLPTNDQTRYRVPLTDMQLSLIRACQHNQDACAIQVFLSVDKLDLLAFQGSWKAILENEPVFGMTIDETTLEMVSGDCPEIGWEEVVVFDEATFESESKTVSVDLKHPTRFKTVILDEKVRAVWTVHHAFIDGYSAHLLMSKVFSVFRGQQVKPGPSIFEILFQVKEIAQAQTQKSALDRRWDQAQKSEYLGRFELYPSAISHASDSQQLNDHVCSLANEWQDISKFARVNSVTQMAVVHTAWALLLSKYTGSKKIVFGSITSGRNIPIHDVDQVIGPMVCRVPIFGTISVTFTIQDLIQKFYDEVHTAAGIEWVLNEKDLENLSVDTTIAWNLDLPKSPFRIDKTYVRSSLPLVLMFEKQCEFRLVYRMDRYTSKNIECIALALKSILQAIVRPDSTVESCLHAALPDDERNRLLENGNISSISSYADQSMATVLDIWDANIDRHRQFRALEFGTTEMTYAEFDNVTTKVAKSIARVAAVNEIVCLQTDRTIDWVIGVFGIIKAGCVYCPIDMRLYADRRQELFEVSGGKVFVVHKSSDIRLAPSTATVVVVIEAAIQDQHQSGLRKFSRNPRSVLYVCFTSGSTGKPKGVLVEHGGLVALLTHPPNRMFAAPGNRIMQTYSPAYDGAIYEVFGTLCYGATLVIPACEEEMYSTLKTVDQVVITPSMIQHARPADYPNLKIVLLAGEPVSQRIVNLWAPERELYNMYGPTETTVAVSLKRLVEGEPVTVGWPVASVRAYIINDERDLCCPGVVGEIAIAGLQVAQGYLNCPDGTKNVFLPDTFSGKVKERMYLTGDLGYWTESGEICLVGRRDRQTKVRGFRLDLDGIEDIIRSQDDVTDVVLAVEEGCLLAWVQPSTIDVAHLRIELARQLSSQALPHKIFALESFPMTNNGKLDVFLLLNNSKSALGMQESSRSLTATERQIAEEWRQVLGLEAHLDLGPHDSFSDLGGHSVKLMALSSRLSIVFQHKISLRLLAGYDRLADLASMIDLSLAASKLQTITNCGGRILQHHNLSPAEIELWYVYTAGRKSDTATFNIPYICNLDASVDYRRLGAAWNEVLAKYTILSSRFVTGCNGKPYRIIAGGTPTVKFASGCFDTDSLVQTPFTLDSESLVRVSISQEKLVFVISHMLCDIVSLRLLLDEVSAAYNESTIINNSQEKYRSYTEALTWIQEPAAVDLAFWKRYLAGWTGLSQKPVSIVDIQGTTRLYNIPLTVTRDVVSFSACHSLPLSHLLPLAVALTVQTLSGTNDVVIGTPDLHARDPQDLHIVGLFLQALPLRLDFSDVDKTATLFDINAIGLIDRTKASFRAILGQSASWHHILQHLGLSYRGQGFTYPIFDTAVTIHDLRTTAPPSLKISGASQAQQATVLKGAKFKLLFEFSMLHPDQLQLKIEYNTSMLEAPVVDLVFNGLLRSLQAICKEYTLLSIRLHILQGLGELLYGQTLAFNNCL